jgi:hypothetical protein
MKRTALLAASWTLLSAFSSAQQSVPSRPDLEVSLEVVGPWDPTAPEPQFHMVKVTFAGDVEGGDGDGLHPGLPSLAERLSPSAHAELAAILDREHFFALPANLGCVYDGGGRSIEAWRGNRQHGVSFCVQQPDLPLRQVQSVLRVWYGVLSLLAEGKRVRLTDVDRRILAKKP